jgi:hypothetical protein
VSILGTIATAAAVTLIPGAGIALAVWRFGKEAVIRFFRSIPPKVWIAIAAVALLVAACFLHGHQVKKAHDAAFAEGAAAEDAKWQKRLDAEHAAALQWKAKADAAATKISQEERARHEDDLNSIAARADAQRLRGPGAAAAAPCGGHGNAARVPAAPGGHVAADRSADAGVDRVPTDEGLAIVSWDDLVDWAAAADGWRSEALTWRTWYPRQAEANRVAREAGPKP